MDDTLFESLKAVRWDVARRTFGSSHATLIGLVSQWWVDRAADHTVLDGAPSFGASNAGWCDLLLCRAGQPAGAVEVEGTRPLEKLHTIGQYLRSPKRELAGIGFGLLVSYAYHVRGRGPAMAYPAAEDPLVMTKALQLSADHPKASIVLVHVDKAVDADRGALRDSVRYYWGSVSGVSAVWLSGGTEKRRLTLLEPMGA